VACTGRTVKAFRCSEIPSYWSLISRRLRAESASLPFADQNPVGFSMDEFDAQLDALEQELRQNIASPPADLPAFLDDWLRRLRGIPFSVLPNRRVGLLIDVASQYYLHGQRIFNAVEPIALAAMLAEQQGEQALLRRALSVQGLSLRRRETHRMRCAHSSGRSTSPRTWATHMERPRHG